MAKYAPDDTNDHKLFPFDIKEENEKISKTLPELIIKQRVFVGPKNYCFFLPYKSIASEIYNFEARPDDVWISGVPRSGTTLTSELVWLLGNNLDYKKAAETVLDYRLPFLDRATFFGEDYKKVTTKLQSYKGINAEIVKQTSKPVCEILSNTQEKRFIKTQLPLSLAPSNILTSGCKVIYVARNPKDVCVSYFMLAKSLKLIRIDESFEKFWNYFQHGLLPFTPFYEHVKEAWEVKDNPNVLFLFYEDYSKDMEQTIRTIAGFLEKEISDSEIVSLMQHLKIDNFRKNQSVNKSHWRNLGIIEDRDDAFIRKGVVGGWNEYFQGHIDIEANNWINENLKNLGLSFPE